jgi:rod shape-determining protein MreD
MSTVYDRTTFHLPRAMGLSAVGLLVAFLVQTSVLPAIGLSAAIPFVYATVAVLAVVLGPRAGAAEGFAAGLLLDLTGSGTLGIGALIGCLLGALAGRVHVDRWWFSGVPMVSVLVVAAGVVSSVANAALGQIPLLLTASWLWVIVGGVVSVVLLMPARFWLRELVR